MGHVAWLGTGLLGSGFVRRLAQRGVVVKVWNRTAAKAQALAGGCVEAVADPQQAVAGASRVHLCLSDDDAVDSVLDAVGSALAPGVPLVDHTTAAPNRTARRHERCVAKGIHHLHAPVFMAPANAEAGTGLMYVCGPQAFYDAVANDLAAMTGKLVYQGPRPDRAAATKLFGNAMILAMVGAMADVMVLARATGVDPQDAMALFAEFPVEKQFAGRGARMAKGDFQPSFELKMARKDVRLMLETSAHVPEMPLCVLDGLAGRMDALLAEGHGAQDVGVLAQAVFGPAAALGRRKDP